MSGYDHSYQYPYTHQNFNESKRNPSMHNMPPPHINRAYSSPNTMNHGIPNLLPPSSQFSRHGSYSHRRSQERNMPNIPSKRYNHNHNRSMHRNPYHSRNIIQSNINQNNNPTFLDYGLSVSFYCIFPCDFAIIYNRYIRFAYIKI